VGGTRTLRARDGKKFVGPEVSNANPVISDLVLGPRRRYENATFTEDRPLRGPPAQLGQTAASGRRPCRHNRSIFSAALLQ
jgi:hypothetical protein